MKETHQKFIELVASGTALKEAYLVVNSEATAAVATAGGVKLAQTYGAQIEGLRQGKTLQEVVNAYDADHHDNGKQILSSHRHFIQLVAGGMSKTDAYLHAISPDAEPTTAKNEGCKLGGRYRTQIAEEREVQKTMLRQLMRQDLKAYEGKLLNEVKVAAQLSSLIMGERGMNGDPDGKASYYDLIKAMELYFKWLGTVRIETEEQNETTQAEQPPTQKRKLRSRSRQAR